MLSNSKQFTTTNSAIEVKYIVASDTTTWTIWSKTLITDVGILPIILDPIPLLCDENRGIELRSHQKSKHILRYFYLIREIVNKGDVVVERVPSNDKILDLLSL